MNGFDFIEGILNLLNGKVKAIFDKVPLPNQFRYEKLEVWVLRQGHLGQLENRLQAREGLHAKILHRHLFSF